MSLTSLVTSKCACGLEHFVLSACGGANALEFDIIFTLGM